MNISLNRLIEGIIATLRTDVIPNVSDAYARGQAVGVIDLLNNIGPRIEWAQKPIAETVAAKRALLEAIGMPAADVDPSSCDTDAAQLIAERDRLDAAIGDAIAIIAARDPESDALARIRSHLHDEQAGEMKKTRKPLFAEIASGAE